MRSSQPVQWAVGTVINLSRNYFTASIPLKFDPTKPRSADSHGDHSLHCLFGINAKDRGAHAKLGFILLRCPQPIARALVSIKNNPTSHLSGTDSHEIWFLFRYSIFGCPVLINGAKNYSYLSDLYIGSASVKHYLKLQNPLPLVMI